MNEKITAELQKLYDDERIDPFVQEICEYFATKDDYAQDSYREELEPASLIEPSYMLFSLQKREAVLDDFTLISQKYPHLFSCVSDFYMNLLVGMDISAMQSRYEHLLVQQIPGLSSAAIYDKVEQLHRTEKTTSEAMDRFLGWLSDHR